MSRENVEVVRAVYAEYERGNFGAGVDLFDADILYIPNPSDPATGRYLGVERAGEFTREWLRAWARLTCTGEEFIDAGNSVVVATRWRGEGRGSGVLTDLRDFTVWTFRGRRVIRVEQFATRADAVEAVGLRE